MGQLDLKATNLTRARYQRLSPMYDRMEGMAEGRYAPWRARLWAQVRERGKIILLEHMRSAHPWIGTVMDLLNPLAVRMMGANINRRTLENIRKAGLEIAVVEDLGMGGIFKLIVAHKP